MEIAQGGDIATSVVGEYMLDHVKEGNPLGVPVLTAAKLLLVTGVKRSNGKTCYNSMGSITQMGWAATLANIATGASLGPGGAIAAGIAGFIGGKPSHNTKFWACAPKA